MSDPSLEIRNGVFPMEVLSLGLQIRDVRPTRPPTAVCNPVRHQSLRGALSQEQAQQDEGGRYG